MAVDTVARLVLVTREATDKIAEGADALFTVLEAFDMDSQEEIEAEGPRSGFRGANDATSSLFPEIVAQSDVDAIRQLVAEAVPYVAQYAEIEAAVAWLRRADSLGCRRR